MVNHILFLSCFLLGFLLHTTTSISLQQEWQLWRNVPQWLLSAVQLDVGLFPTHKIHYLPKHEHFDFILFLHPFASEEEKSHVNTASRISAHKIEEAVD